MLYARPYTRYIELGLFNGKQQKRNLANLKGKGIYWMVMGTHRTQLKAKQLALRKDMKGSARNPDYNKQSISSAPCFTPWCLSV